jgi:hypothetical protein
MSPRSLDGVPVQRGTGIPRLSLNPAPVVPAAPQPMLLIVDDDPVVRRCRPFESEAIAAIPNLGNVSRSRR